MRKTVIMVAMLAAVSVGGIDAPTGPWRSAGAPATNVSEASSVCQTTGTWSSAGSPRVYFSPDYGGGSCTSNLVAEIGKARRTIRVGAYQFTSQPIADALVGAKKRGVDVEMVVDNLAVEGRNSKVGLCASNGIPVVVDRKHGIYHNKTMVIDGRTVVTGSFNFTANAENRNAENMWILESRDLAAQCLSNWTAHASHSVPLGK